MVEEANPEPIEQRGEQKQKKWYERSLYLMLVIVVSAALFGSVLLWVMDAYLNPTSVTERRAIVQLTIVYVGGATFLFGLSFIARYLQVPHYGVIAVTFMVIVGVLWALVRPENAEHRIRFFQTVGGIVAGSALLFGLYFTSQTMREYQEKRQTS